MAQKKTKIFNVTHKSEVDDCTYDGTFACKKLSVRDRAQITVVKVRLNGGMHYDEDKPGYGVDESVDSFNHMMAHLEVALTNTPGWWDLDEIGDPEVVAAVFSEVVAFEASFRKRIRSDRSSEGGSSASDPESVSGGTAQPVVGEEVQAALEP